ncbi:hypothetical protein LIER_11977 [Lithospermum erythrorhizon]|uniref:Uncharacterized protein n=1 Tax=Lithospermum erythrorhizon TaxID=34254 RepID=A0AAV3PUB7_LITER
MSTYFTNINKTCPKDCHPHPNIDRETFENIRKYQLQLNLEKCIFGVTSGNFSSYMVRQKGIEPNLDKKADIVIKKVHLGSLLNCRRGKTNF